jgi:hypothetical protein
VNPAIETMAEFVRRYYGLSPETALEVVSELRDKKSLRGLTEPRCERAVLERRENENDLLTG